MAKKTATVSARIDENVKDQAEGILRQLGIPVSVVINTLYHQIINRGGIPFALTLPDKDNPPTNEDGSASKKVSKRREKRS